MTHITRVYTYRTRVLIEELLILVGCIIVGGAFAWALMQSAEVLLFPIVVSAAAVPPLVYVLCLYAFARIEYDGARMRVKNWIGRERLYNLAMLDANDVTKTLRRGLRAHYVYKVQMIGAAIKWSGLLDGAEELYQSILADHGRISADRVLSAKC